MPMSQVAVSGSTSNNNRFSLQPGDTPVRDWLQSVDPSPRD